MNRAGEYVSNGSGEAAYASFRSAALPPVPPLELNADTVRLLVEANRSLAALNTAAGLIPSAARNRVFAYQEYLDILRKDA